MAMSHPPLQALVAFLQQLQRTRGYSPHSHAVEWQAFSAFHGHFLSSSSLYPASQVEVDGERWKGMDICKQFDGLELPATLDPLQATVLLGRWAPVEEREKLLSMVRFWVASGFEPGRYCHKTGTSTGLAALSGQPDVLALLAKTGTNLVLPLRAEHGGQDDTLLHRCMGPAVIDAPESPGMQAVVRLLVEAYGTTEPLDARGLTPLDWARIHRRDVMMALLESMKLEHLPEASGSSGRSLRL
jgi:hypothetical protein